MCPNLSTIRNAGSDGFSKMTHIELITYWREKSFTIQVEIDESDPDKKHVRIYLVEANYLPICIRLVDVLNIANDSPCGNKLSTVHLFDMMRTLHMFDPVAHHVSIQEVLRQLHDITRDVMVDIYSECDRFSEACDHIRRVNNLHMSALFFVLVISLMLFGLPQATFFSASIDLWMKMSLGITMVSTIVFTILSLWWTFGMDKKKKTK